MTENKTEKRRVVTRLCIALVVLTLLSCCFLGSTFAKYVTGGSGNATVGIAKWDVAVTPAGSGNVAFGKLSPSVTENTHSTGYIVVAEITNSGDVDAEVTIAKNDLPTAQLADGAESDGGYNTYYSDDQVEAMFAIKFVADDSGTALADTFTVPAGGSQKIYAQVTWTTVSDPQDTWYGEWMESVSWTISYTATQSTQIPA